MCPMQTNSERKPLCRLMIPQEKMMDKEDMKENDQYRYEKVKTIQGFGQGKTGMVKRNLCVQL